MFLKITSMLIVVSAFIAFLTLILSKMLMKYQEKILVYKTIKQALPNFFQTPPYISMPLPLRFAKIMELFHAAELFGNRDIAKIYPVYIKALEKYHQGLEDKLEDIRLKELYTELANQTMIIEEFINKNI